MKVIIDLDKCYKSGECYYNHPELFALSKKEGEEGFPVVIVDQLDPDSSTELLRHAREAIEVCPAVAISLE